MAVTPSASLTSRIRSAYGPHSYLRPEGLGMSFSMVRTPSPPRVHPSPAMAPSDPAIGEPSVAKATLSSLATGISRSPASAARAATGPVANEETRMADAAISESAPTERLFPIRTSFFQEGHAPRATRGWQKPLFLERLHVGEPNGCIQLDRWAVLINVQGERHGIAAQHERPRVARSH